MRKAVEKLISLAIENNFTNEEIDILKREDLTIPVLNIIYGYFLKNNEYYTSDKLCKEVNRVLKLPFTGKKKDYLNKLCFILSGYRKDLLMDSINKRILMRLDVKKFNSEVFYYIYRCLLIYNVDYQLIRDVYKIVKDNSKEDCIFYLKDLLCILKNESNANTILKILIQCYIHKDEFCNYHYEFVFDNLARYFATTDDYIDVDIDDDWINKYIINYNRKTNYNLLFDIIYKYQDNSFIINLFNILGKNNFEQGYSSTHKTNTYNFSIRQKDNTLVDKFKELSIKTNTNVSIQSVNSELHVKIKEKEITIHLEEFSRVSLFPSLDGQDANIKYYSKRKNIILWIPKEGYIYKAIFRT